MVVDIPIQQLMQADAVYAPTPILRTDTAPARPCEGVLFLFEALQTVFGSALLGKTDIVEISERFLTGSTRLRNSIGSA